MSVFFPLQRLPGAYRPIRGEVWRAKGWIAYYGAIPMCDADCKGWKCTMAVVHLLI
jgi:hypothetical protein